MTRPLPGREPDTDRRWVVRVPPDPHVAFDSFEYSFDPELVGRRVECVSRLGNYDQIVMIRGYSAHNPVLLI